MKVLLALGLLWTMVAPANAALVKFIGSASVYAQTGSCPDDGTIVGTSMVARFMPRDLTVNNPDSDLNLFGQTSAIGLRLFNGVFGTTPKKVQETYIGNGSGSPPAAVQTTSVSFSTQTAVTPATKVVVIYGKIIGFDFQPTCNLSFVFSGTRE